MKNCLNCGVNISATQRFCPNCGQKTTFKDLSLWMVFKDFVKNVFNLESKIWNSLKDIWIPGKLTTAYIKGVRNKYFNPIRFFLVTLFAFFALVVFISNSFITAVDYHLENQKKLAWQIELEEDFEKVTKTIPLDSSYVSQMREELFPKDWATFTNDSTGAVRFAFGESDLVQFYQLSEEDLIAKLQPESKFQETILKSVKKVFMSPREGITFMIGNGAWIIVLLVLLISVLFKLLYFRKNYLYVEHFILHLYGHTRMLLVGFILLPIGFYLYSSIFLFLLFILIGTVYLLLTMLSIYKQSFLITFFKLVLTGLIYLLLAGLSIQGILFLSIVIF